MSTELHKQMLEFNYADLDRGDLMRDVWAPTPWMVNAFTDRTNSNREREIADWCYSRLGQQSSPIHKAEGRWHRGGATINGWTWMGFATEADMLAFVDRWPSPVSEENVA